MNRTDPYTPSGVYIYECIKCGKHFESETRISECEECGSEVRNIAVPRE